MPRPILLLAFLAGLASGACFRPPSADVLFACDPATAPECPPGYTCQDDGCCHKDGTDPDENRGACMVFGTASGGATGSGTASGASGSTGSGTAGGSTGSGTAATAGSSGTTGATGTDTGTTG